MEACLFLASFKRPAKFRADESDGQYEDFSYSQTSITRTSEPAALTGRELMIPVPFRASKKASIF